MIYPGLMATGALGAVLRYVIDRVLQGTSPRSFPLGTLIINVTGSLALGFLTGLALYHAFSSTPHALLGTGFCGAYTTFSTHAVETVRLAEEGAARGALLNTAGNLLLGTTAAAIGLGIAGIV